MRSVITSLVATICLVGYTLAAEDGVPESETLFKQLDGNSDGFLTSDEISDDKRPLFERLIRKADDNEDGKLSLKEFRAAHEEDASPNLPLNTGGGRPNRAGGELRQRFVMLDRNKDGKVTRDEVPEQARQRLMPLFERLGKEELTLADLERAIGGGEGNRPDSNRQLGPAGPRGPVFMRLLDTDRDGRISKSEWAKASEIFGQLDENSDGELDPRELMGPPPEEMSPDRERMERRDARTQPGEPAAGPGREFFARLDTNNDGKISKDEAPPRMRDRFDRLDANQDGSLTPDELRNAFPGGRPKGGPDGENRPDRSEGRARPKRPASE